MINFTDSNYPKSWGTSDKDDYRLKDFLDKSEKELERIETSLWNFIYNKAESSNALRKYKDYKNIGAGWEWSVFLKEDKVIKIAAGIFPEVNDLKYLENTETAYNKLLNYFPESFVAKTEFKRKDNTNFMYQTFVEGDDSFKIAASLRDNKVLKNIYNFLASSLSMIEELEWLPDFDIKKLDDGFNFRNVIIEQKTKLPVIIDFTSYYDVYRMYPARTKKEVKIKRDYIKEFMKWIDSKI